MRQETVTTMTLVPQKPTKSLPVRAGGPGALSSPPNAEDMIPYSAKDLKYLWAMWDEAHRYHPPTGRHRNIYAGCGGVILVGWIISGMGLSCSVPLGGGLMFGGALIGAWYCLKSLRHKKHSALEG
jgi:hypothetical protein